MKSDDAINAIPEMVVLCVSVETVHKPDLVDLRDYIARRNFVPCSGLRREIALARKNPDRFYQALDRQANCVRFASSDDFSRWLKKLAAALDIIEKRLGVGE